MLGIVFVYLFQFILFMHQNSLTSDLNHEYSVIQSKYDVVANIQTRRDEIMFLSGMYTTQSRSILDAIVFTEFYDQDTENLTERYRRGEIDFPTYWSKVLQFYNEDYTKLTQGITVQTSEIDKLRARIDFWESLYIVYNTLIMIPLSLVLTILLTLRLEKKLRG